MVYSYECALGHVTDKNATIEERLDSIECPFCAAFIGRRVARRVLSPTPTTFHYNDRSGIKRSRE